MSRPEVKDQLPPAPPVRPDPLQLAYRVEGVAPWRQELSGRFLGLYFGFWNFLATHWLFLLNLLNGLCLVAAFAVPLLALAGWEEPARLIFGLFHYICVQNPQHSFYIAGRQMCLCQRCLAIYSGLLLAGLLFQALRGRLRPLPLWQFLLFFCPPIAVDSLTQLFGWRESTWELRFLTGGLFALGAVWTLYPLVEQKMARLVRWSRREQNWSAGSSLT